MEARNVTSRVKLEAPLPTVSGPARTRLVYLDNLKTLMIAGIIAAHAVMGYAEFGSWTYQDVREVSLSDVGETIFVLLQVTLGGLFLMALFFLISGLLTQDSLARKGSSSFVRDRLLRLGVPFLAYLFVIWPLTEYATLEPFLHPGFWRSYADTDPVLDNGPMWFVGVLLVYSLVLVAWRSRFPAPDTVGGELRLRDLVRLWLAVGVATFLVRIGLPLASNQPLNAHLWGWPEYVAMFGLGVVASRRGWLRPVPKALARWTGTATIVVMLVLPVAILSTAPLGLDEEAWFGGATIWAFFSAMSEGVIAVSAPIWILAFAQRHLDRSGPLRRSMARASYAAFMLQGPVLVALALSFRLIDLPGDAKALLVATLGIVGSFGLAHPLVTKTPIGRVL